MISVLREVLVRFCDFSSSPLKMYADEASHRATDRQPMIVLNDAKPIFIDDPA